MGIPGILAAATYYLQAISAGGFVTGLLLLLKFLAKGVKLPLEAASVVSLRIRFVATGAGGRAAGSDAGKVARIDSSFVILFSAFVILFSACSAGPPQLITHSCIVAKLFSLPGGSLNERRGTDKVKKHLGSHQRQRVCKTLSGGQNRIDGAWPGTGNELWKCR